MVKRQKNDSANHDGLGFGGGDRVRAGEVAVDLVGLAADLRGRGTAISVTSPASVFIRSHWWCSTSHRWYPDVFACAVPWSR